MLAPAMPRVLHRGRWWSADELDAMARRWHAAALERLGGTGRLVATALPPTPDGVALFVALTALPSPLLVLGPDVRAWRTEPAVPAGTPLVLPPSLASLGPDALDFGMIPLVLPEPGGGRGAGTPLVPLQGPGVMVLTSGSTGLPKPVYRPTKTVIRWTMARVEALKLRRGAGILMGVSLATGEGLHNLLMSVLLGGALGLLDPVDHRAALHALAQPEFQCWRATPHFADILGRCPLVGPALAPRFCLVSSPISRGVYDAFLGRFGVPLRQTYACTETGVVTFDDAPLSAVRPDTVGRALAGVEISIGDHPAAPRPPGEAARIWVRGPSLMDGYGFPPAVDRSGYVDGWWPTQDVGALEVDGHLVLAGRIDDCLRTREGRLVNLAAVAATIRGIPGVRDATVVPLDGPAGSTFGAVVQCEPGLVTTTVRAGLARVLPSWSSPRAVELVPSLPRLPSGRPDRQACIAVLGRARVP
jgi:acyl-CoA synthetase (AMP-forming)/AMP-acid ligase II